MPTRWHSGMDTHTPREIRTPVPAAGDQSRSWVPGIGQPSLWVRNPTRKRFFLPDWNFTYREKPQGVGDEGEKDTSA